MYKKKIVAIRKVGVRPVMDIEVDGDRLFYANGVLTHNSGQNHSDVDLEQIGESHGTSQTADFVFALIRSGDLIERNQVMIKQLKNRFGDKSVHTKFLIGVDMSTMSFYDTGEGVAKPDDTIPASDGGGFDEIMPTESLAFGDSM